MRDFEIINFRHDGRARYAVVVESDDYPDVRNVVETFPRTQTGLNAARAYIARVQELDETNSR